MIPIYGKWHSCCKPPPSTYYIYICYIILMSYNAQCRTGCQKFLGDSCNSCSQELQKCANPLVALYRWHRWKWTSTPINGAYWAIIWGGVPLNCLKKWRTLKLSIDSIVYDNHNWYYKLQTVSRGYIGITPTILVTPPPMNACSPFVLPSTPMFGDWSEIISAGFRPDSFLITTDHMHGKNEACAFPEQGCIPWRKSGVRHGQNRCRWVYTMYIHYGETG